MTTHDRENHVFNRPEYKCQACGRYTMDLSSHKDCRDVCVFCYGRFLDDIRHMPPAKKQKPEAREGYKTCSSCHEELPLYEYAARTASPDGLQYSCKACVKRAQWKSKKRR